MLTVDNINLHYGAAQALRGVSIKAEAGKITCVLGRNGVGKSSLLRAVTGQHAVSAGTITFGETTLNGLPPFARARKGIGYVPQGREIFPLLTVQENLETGYAPLARKDRSIPDDIFSLFPVLRSMLARRGGVWLVGSAALIEWLDPASGELAEPLRYLQDRRPTAVLEDHHGRLWSNQGEGVTRYDPESGQILRWRFVLQGFENP